MSREFPGKNRRSRKTRTFGSYHRPETREKPRYVTGDVRGTDPATRSGMSTTQIITSRDLQIAITVRSSHGTEKAAINAAKKVPCAIIVLEPETPVTNARWLVAVPR